MSPMSASEPSSEARRLLAAKRTAREVLGARPGVRGIGIGDHCLRVYVVDAATGRQLPGEVDGVPLECVEVGDLRAQHRGGA
ncbi:hypothetical protein [Egicoccus halophilus]|uniref:Uncharacterized protein n=1 Tax=Egicoccus halophilus TaxID=1670830 RepID=A0A8J3EVE9_9ACTN|nr:hypothetical protein [Egicoccus halophilus]GGI07986.1 hypothetical protein GCM10011354_26820 [Egicoccus halophilus]